MTKGVWIASLCVWMGIAAYNESLLGVCIVAGWHMMIWQIHRVETKINQLLELQNLRIAGRDLTD